MNPEIKRRIEDGLLSLTEHTRVVGDMHESGLCLVEVLVAQTEALYLREEACKEHEARIATQLQEIHDRREGLYLREKDIEGREKAQRNLTQELSQRKARIQTLEEEIKKQEAKVQLARKEKGEVKAELTGLRKAIAGIRSTERGGALDALDAIQTSGYVAPVEQDFKATEERIAAGNEKLSGGCSPADMLKG